MATTSPRYQHSTSSHLLAIAAPSPRFAQALHQARTKAVRLDGRPVGRIVQGDCFERRVSRSKHLLRYPRPAWACDLRVLALAALMGATRVRVVDRESGETWACDLADFHGPESFAVDRGWGVQRGLPLTAACWTSRRREMRAEHGSS